MCGHVASYYFTPWNDDAVAMLSAGSLVWASPDSTSLKQTNLSASSLSWVHSCFHKAWAQLVGKHCFFFFSPQVHVLVFVTKVLPSDDHRCCESQKCEKLLSSCFIFIMIFFSCLLYQCCPKCHELPFITESWQYFVLVNLCSSPKQVATLCAAFFADS